MDESIPYEILQHLMEFSSIRQDYLVGVINLVGVISSSSFVFEEVSS